MDTPAELRGKWQAAVEARLCPLPSLRRRNADITRSYVDWYARSPQLLKWAGLAAFVSRQVGRAATIQRYAQSISSPGEISKLGAAGAPNLLPKLDAIAAQLAPMSAINGSLATELGWVHEAYLHGGYAAVEAALTDQPQSPLLDAFRRIEAGRVALDHGDTPAAERDIWDGNFVLLEYEQRVLVQPTAATLGCPLGRILSLMSWVELDPDDAAKGSPGALIALLREADDLIAGSATVSSFGWYMCKQPPELALFGATRPDFTRFEHRWDWTEHDLWPLWRRIETSDVSLRQRMPAMAKLTLM